MKFPLLDTEKNPISEDVRNEGCYYGKHLGGAARCRGKLHELAWIALGSANLFQTCEYHLGKYTKQAEYRCVSKFLEICREALK